MTDCGTPQAQYSAQVANLTLAKSKRAERVVHAGSNGVHDGRSTASVVYVRGHPKKPLWGALSWAPPAPYFLNAKMCGFAKFETILKVFGFSRNMKSLKNVRASSWRARPLS